MKIDRGELEGGYRLLHIRRTKLYLYLVQIALMLIFATYLVLASGNFSLKPFYLSINSFIYFILIMGLLIAVESFVFRRLEMRFIKSESTKYYMAKRSVLTSMTVIVVCAVIIFLLWLPFIPDAAGEAMRSSGTITSTSTTVPSLATFYNTDPLGMTEVTSLEFTASGGTAEIFVLTEDNYLLFGGEGKNVVATYRINTYDYSADPELTIDFPSTAHERFYILAYSDTGSLVQIDYRINSNISSITLSLIPLFATIFLVAYGVWAVYMYPISKRYSKGAIYK